MNIGSDEIISFNDLAQLVMNLAGEKPVDQQHSGSNRCPRKELRQPIDSGKAEVEAKHASERRDTKNLPVGASTGGNQREGRLIRFAVARQAP